MTGIFYDIGKMVKRKELKQKDIAEKLGISNTHISAILKGRCEPSKTLTMLAEIVFGGKPTEHPNKRIEAIVKTLEGMEPDTLQSALVCIEKEERLERLKKMEQGKHVA
ncbi:helix-turn-helix domain-containing protein [Oryzomonas japonica]|nr:helix-turn-helix transcriptional regulator [Oryzomonas japonica]